MRTDLVHLLAGKGWTVRVAWGTPLPVPAILEAQRGLAAASATASAVRVPLNHKASALLGIASREQGLHAALLVMGLVLVRVARAATPRGWQEQLCAGAGAPPP